MDPVYKRDTGVDLVLPFVAVFLVALSGPFVFLGPELRRKLCLSGVVLDIFLWSFVTQVNNSISVLKKSSK